MLKDEASFMVVLVLANFHCQGQQNIRSNMESFPFLNTVSVLVPHSVRGRVERARRRYSVEEWKRRHVAANVLLALAMQICKYQHDHKAGFIFEHPSGASSWSEPDVEFVRQLPDVRKVIFDACAVGAVTKVDRFPVKKSIALLTNIPEIVAKFETQKCRCPVQMIDGKMQRHRAIMG